ncbi:MAG: NAD-binding protein [Candidatus Nitrotoga sp.]
MIRYKLFLWLQKYKWAIIVSLYFISFVLAVMGFIGQHKSLSNAIFYTLQMIVLNYGDFADPMPVEFQIARFSLPLIAAWALVTALLAKAYEHVNKLERKSWHGHIVICGLGEKGRSLALSYLGKIKSDLPADKCTGPVIVVEQDPSNPYVAEIRKKGGVVLIGYANDESLLEEIPVKHAKFVYALTGNDNLNRQIVEKVVGVANNENIPCFAHFHDDQIRRMLQDSVLQKKEAQDKDYQNVQFFSGVKNAVRELFKQHPIDQFVTAGNVDTLPNIGVIGFGWLGQALTVQAANLWQHEDAECRLGVTVIDPGIADISKRFLARFPALNKDFSSWNPMESKFAPLLRLNFIADDALAIDAEFVKKHQLGTVKVFYICIPDEETAVKVAQMLVRAYRDFSCGESGSGCVADIKVVLCLPKGISLAHDLKSSLEKTGVCFFDALSNAVPLTNNESFIGEHLDADAKRIHEFYRTKYDIPVWENLSESLRESNRYSADHIDVKKRAIFKAGDDINALIDNHKEVLMQMEHQRWCAERLLDGWRYTQRAMKNGAPDGEPDKDKIKADKLKNLSYCLVPYSSLPTKEDKEKDKDVVDIMKKVLNQRCEQMR